MLKNNNTQYAYIALGSNLPFKGIEPINVLHKAIGEISQYVDKITDISRFYKSKAWPEGNNSPDYINCIIKVEVQNNNPSELLQNLQKIEYSFGRERDINNQWAARTLDIDIIDFNGIILEDNSIILPHPRADIRDFVILPLFDINPNWQNPNTHKKIAELLMNFKDSASYKVCSPVMGA